MVSPKFALAIAVSVSAFAADTAPRIFPAAKVEEVYRIVLDRDALLLESINAAIKEKRVQDGHVSITAGSVQECTYHYVTSTAVKPVDAFKTVKGPFEILNGGGIVANGEPHIHITLSSPQGAFGGHLENNCRILYLGEVTLTKYAGPPLARKKNEHGVAILQPK